MSELVRSAVERLRWALSARPQRRPARLPVVVSLSGGDRSDDGRPDCCAGHTRDLSERGLSFVLPSVRLGDRHVFGEGVLRIRLELPTGPVSMAAAPIRYDLLDGREAEWAYLVGALIVEMSGEGRARYLQFLGAPPHR